MRFWEIGETMKMCGHKRTVGVLVGLLSMLAFLGFNDTVFAAEGGGSGGSSWNSNGCYKARTSQNVSQCPDEYGVGGGASWHVFKVGNSPVFDNTANEPVSGRPIVRHGVVGYGYPDRWGRTVENTCRGFEYYVAYVYDGWWGVQNWYNTKYWGPIAWGEYGDVSGGVIHRPIYHNADYNRLHPNAKRDYTWAQVSAELVKLRQGQPAANMNGWRIQGERPLSTYENNYQSAEALKAYRVFSGNLNATKIPNGTGFFCAGPMQYTVTVRSIDTSGRSLAGVTGLGNFSRVANVGSSVTVSHGNTSAGFTFKYWRSSGGSNLGNGNSYTVSTGVDTVIYAVYEAFNASSTIDIQQKKSNENNYRNDVIYAKPEDEINFQTVYNPLAQGGYSLRPQRISVNNDASRAISTTLGQAMAGWSNSIRLEGMGSAIDHGYTNGNTGQKIEYNKYVVLKTEAGKELTETAKLRDDSAKTPSRVQIDLEGGSGGPSIGRVYTGLSDAVKVRVPYNFENDTDKPGHPGDNDPNPDDPDDPNNPGTDGNGNEKVVYAGEEDSFSFTINVNPRENPVTGGNYATIVRDAKWRLGLCYGAMCNSENYNYTAEKTGNLNESFNMNGEQGIQRNLDINIPDIKAGSKICVVAEVWPADSGDYTNWQTSGYRNEWRRSPRACYTVAKRPSIQFWGGNIYSRANLITSTAKKVRKNMAGYSSTYEAVAEGNQEIRAFGSWGELGVVGNGAISGFGSGASMGYLRNNGDGTTWPSYNPLNGLGNNANIQGEPGGSGESKFCKRIPLTIPNTPCEEDGVSGLSSAVSTTKAASDKISIVNLLASGDNTVNRVHNPGSTIGRSIVGETIDGSTTRVISADEDITIGEDLIYLNGEYSNYRQMPKLVIYSKKNIYIDCNVGRVDALLIADDTVVTCNNFEGVLNENNIMKRINDGANSKQLFINGAIIAKRLIANRTYGAATGANSIVPAEIVDFDPTLYQFGGSAVADDDATGRLDVTSMHELPPRL